MIFYNSDAIKESEVYKEKLLIIILVMYRLRQSSGLLVSLLIVFINFWFVITGELLSVLLPLTSLISEPKYIVASGNVILIVLNVFLLFSSEKMYEEKEKYVKLSNRKTGDDISELAYDVSKSLHRFIAEFLLIKYEIVLRRKRELNTILVIPIMFFLLGCIFFMISFIINNFGILQFLFIGGFTCIMIIINSYFLTFIIRHYFIDSSDIEERKNINKIT